MRALDLSLVSTKQQRIAELAKQAPQMSFTSLNHHIDFPWLAEAYQRTRKDGAVGIDGQTADAYEMGLEGNLRSLLERAKAGTYKAPPVRRVHIPKGKGNETRPIGIPTFEDKVLQRAVAMVLESIYEQDFYDCSYGFRPNRSARQATDELWKQSMNAKARWILEVDVRKFFDTLDHTHLRSFLQRRVRDGVLRRLIDKWLKAGVMEDGTWTQPSAGSPQGGVISPLLANVYLHYVLDEWFHETVQDYMNGETFLIRYADDFVIGFTNESDARRIMEVLPKRFAKFGLTIHPDKTRLIRFHRPRNNNDSRPKPDSFDLLGFTFHWKKSRKGQWVVGQTTAPDRLARSVRAISDWCRRHRHLPVRDQHAALVRKVRGHCQYYGVRGNSNSLEAFKHWTVRAWHKWLGRRKRDGGIPWSEFARLLERYPIRRPRMLPSVANP